jgi:hypothetical protein
MQISELVRRHFYINDEDYKIVYLPIYHISSIQTKVSISVYQIIISQIPITQNITMPQSSFRPFEYVSNTEMQKLS